MSQLLFLILSCILQLSYGQTGPCGTIPCDQCRNQFCAGCLDRNCSCFNLQCSYSCGDCGSPTPWCSTTTIEGGQSEALSDWVHCIIVFAVVTLFYLIVYYLINKYKKQNSKHGRLTKLADSKSSWDIPAKTGILDIEGSKIPWELYWKQEHEILSLCYGNFSKVGRTERWGVLFCILLTAFSLSLLFVSIAQNSKTVSTVCWTGTGWRNSTSTVVETFGTSQTAAASATVSIMGIVYKFVLGAFAEASTYYGGGFKVFHLFSLITGIVTLGTAFLIKFVVFGGDMQFYSYLYTFIATKCTDWFLLNYVMSKVQYTVGSCFYRDKSNSKSDLEQNLFSKETTPIISKAQVPLQSFPPPSSSSTSPYVLPPPSRSPYVSDIPPPSRSPYVSDIPPPPSRLSPYIQPNYSSQISQTSSSTVPSPSSIPGYIQSPNKFGGNPYQPLPSTKYDDF